jgi:hypothetical protein
LHSDLNRAVFCEVRVGQSEGWRAEGSKAFKKKQFQHVLGNHWHHKGGKESQKDMKAAADAISAAKKLHELLTPIMQSVQAATAALK